MKGKPLNLNSATKRAQAIHLGEDPGELCLAPGAPALLIVRCEDCAETTATRHPAVLIACGWWVETRHLPEVPRPKDFTSVPGVCPRCLGALPLMQHVQCDGREDGQPCLHHARTVDPRALERAGWARRGNKWYCIGCARWGRATAQGRALRVATAGRVDAQRPAWWHGVAHRPGLTARPYEATIRVHGKTRSLGTFATAEEAARAYDRAKWEIRRDVSVLNFPEEYREDRREQMAA